MKALCLLILFVVNIYSFGQIKKVEQVVYGMDCAPCAYGLEGSLKRLEGVEEVTVSLNEGKAYLILLPENKLTLSKIQKRVDDNGFSPRDAEIALKGVLLKEDNSLIVKVNDTESYLVSENSDSDALARLKMKPAGSKVALRGVVKKDKEKQEGSRWSIILHE